VGTRTRDLYRIDFQALLSTLLRTVLRFPRVKNLPQFRKPGNSWYICTKLRRVWNFMWNYGAVDYPSQTVTLDIGFPTPFLSILS
jgi:hypothetical protein